MTPMEEQDPELVINPIMVHKMRMNTERQRKKKMSKMQSGIGKSGGLARLNFHIEDKPMQVDPKKLEISQVDTYLEKERGIEDAGKNKSAYERELASKALAKGQKKAATVSNLNAERQKKEQRAQARLEARKAGTHVPQADPDSDDEYAPPSGGNRGSYGRQGKRGSAQVSAVL